MPGNAIQGAAFRVLAAFYDRESESFAEICKHAGYPSDLGGYYIRQLVAGGHLDKGERGQYVITPKGKQQLALYYGHQLLAPWPRLMAMLVIRQGEKYITLNRTVQPYIGQTEWPASMVQHGEPLNVAAERILKARLGIKTDLTYVGTFRRLDYYDDYVFDDKYFGIFTATVPDDVTIQPKADTGTPAVYSAQEMTQLERPSLALLDILRFVQQPPETRYQEKAYHLKHEDLHRL